MFIKSAASDTNQGKAIQSINEKWGETGSSGRPWGGRETIGIQVCKKKYSPFLFTIENPNDDENDTKNINATGSSSGHKTKVVKVVRMFGCPHHSDIRKEKIERHGVRKGWEPFGRWSLRKARQLARNASIRLNSDCDDGGRKVATLPDDGSNTGSNPIGSSSRRKNNGLTIEEIKTVCHNGKCLWKKRDKYDNVYNEITGHSESSGEEDTPRHSASSS
uniref:Uncharacterized protein n=1 Tax=Pseudo-nitzschia australis TaxID=44445 RepID=A0A6U9VVC3_9STRA|mmetsp:Transcript_26158/g.57272  ORF Transcript_26158/g.57272 Transcript_26158/m.57272 type:complete len:219 (+) Transcript_26158:487-1143(+)